MSMGLKVCVLRVQKLWTATRLGSPDASPYVGVLTGCQTSGNVRNAHIHGSFELLVWELIMCSWAWTLLGSVGWTNSACAIQLLLVHLKEMQDFREELD